jgi:hypothetical protein
MKYIAYLTAKENTLGADPGITVKDEDPYTLVGEWQLPEVPLHGEPRLNEHGDYLDIEHADHILACSGWERVGDWINSGGQWAAEVEDQQAAEQD